MVTVFEVYEEYFADAERRGVRAISKLRNRAAHVIPLMGATPIDDITTAQLRELQRAVGEKLSPASVNGVLSVLQAAINEAVRNGHLAAPPAQPRRLREPPPRRGFLEPSDYEAIAAELDEPARSIFEFSYLTGWRKNEVLGLTWDEVSLEGGYIELSPERSKNGESRPLPLSGRVGEIILAQSEHRNGTHVFARNGAPYPDATFSDHFRAARKRAGREHLHYHDTRRTAARNLVRAGVPERVAMQVTGHSRQMFDRYNVTSGKDLQLALESVSAPTNCGLTSVVPIRNSTDMGETDGINVRKLREEIGLTLTELAAKIGVTESTVRKWEGGTRNITKPSLRLLMVLVEEHRKKVTA